MERPQFARANWNWIWSTAFCASAENRFIFLRKKFDPLAVLMQHKDIPLTHARLLRAVWGSEYGNEADLSEVLRQGVTEKD